jgi:myosin-5
MVEKAYSLRLDFCNLQDIQRFELSDPRSFRYLNQSSCIEVDRINDAEEYLATRRVMDIVGINEEEQVSLLLF